jgi:hypothetical protein
MSPLSFRWSQHHSGGVLGALAMLCTGAQGVIDARIGSFAVSYPMLAARHRSWSDSVPGGFKFALGLLLIGGLLFAHRSAGATPRTRGASNGKRLANGLMLGLILAFHVGATAASSATCTNPQWHTVFQLDPARNGCPGEWQPITVPSLTTPNETVVVCVRALGLILCPDSALPLLGRVAKCSLCSVSSLVSLGRVVGCSRMSHRVRPFLRRVGPTPKSVAKW